jgi:hypothetical protein
MGKYEPLAHFLDSCNEDSWTATFDQIETKLGFKLPKSAYEYRAWWSNQQGPGHSQKEAWQAAGWETREVDLCRKVVRFVRQRRPGKDAGGSPVGRPLEDLWRKAERLTGIGDREALVELALRELIQNELARQVAELGGSDPHATAAPRRRFW